MKTFSSRFDEERLLFAIVWNVFAVLRDMSLWEDPIFLMFYIKFLVCFFTWPISDVAFGFSFDEYRFILAQLLLLDR